MNADVVRLTPAALRGDIDAMAAIIAEIARAHDIRVVVDADASHSAFVAARRIVVPPLDGFRDFAKTLHELAHCVAGPCQGPLHQPDRAAQDSHRCLECESRPWEIAQAWFPFNPEMFSTQRYCLGTYRACTPGSPAAVQHLDRARGTVAWAKSRQTHQRQADFRSKVATVERWKQQEVRRSRPLQEKAALVRQWRG